MTQGEKLHFYDIAQKVVQQIRSEAESNAHQMLRSYPGNTNKAEETKTYGIDHPGSTGVIYVMDRAMQNGFTYGDPAWANFGQGAPEVGHIDGCADKPTSVDLPEASYEYAPTAGIKELRSAVADLYNDIYRQDKESKYTYENVCIVPGGRAGLTRVAAAIDDINVGYFLPEYTAYEQMLSVFKRFVPIPTTLEKENRYHIDPATIKKEISNRGLGLIVASNPRNPTGQLIETEELQELVSISRERHATLVMDEFYSAYIYSHDESENGRTVSISEYVDDVNKDPVIIIDGLTKNFRLPGWRICWIVGPKDVVSSMQSCGSFLEGGANHPLQLAAIPLLNPDVYRNEAKYLQQHFRAKRDFVLQRLEEIGLKVKVPPVATFYIWLDLTANPAPIDIGLTFFEECLKEKVIVVPGIFFDVNPAHRRELFESPCHHFVRLSFGPPMEELTKGLDAIERGMYICFLNIYKKM
ncbi:aminotransferase [Phascolomyces articulosus]|uniref:Aminotransferase n=1 Tax=Phascolomyces articulosus TaxID=60185 RepID=A0AAD5K2U5_9FUNG|nr:aminotransferase [Phascolomyces articulosus]